MDLFKQPIPQEANGPGPELIALPAFSPLMIASTLRRKGCYHPHLVDKDTFTEAIFFAQGHLIHNAIYLAPILMLLATTLNRCIHETNQEQVTRQAE